MSENENSARPRCDFIYTKNSARPRSDFIYTKNFQEGRCDRKWRFYNKETTGGAQFFRYLILSYLIYFYLHISAQRISSEKSDPILSTQRTFKRDDVTENGDFTLRKQRLQGTKYFRYFILSYFIYTKNFLRKIKNNSMIYSKIFRAARASLLRVVKNPCFHDVYSEILFRKQNEMYGY